MSESTTVVTSATFDDVLAEFDTPAQNQEVNLATTVDSSFDDAVSKQDDAQNDGDKGKKVEAQVKTFDDAIKEDSKKEEETQTTPNALKEALEELVQNGEFSLFEDKQDLSQYSKEELIDLIKANDEQKIQDSVDKELSSFFESLPKDFQYALKYINDGGKDLKSLYKALSATEDIRNLSVDNKSDRQEIIRQYYSALEWSSEEIEDELKRLADLGDEAEIKQAQKFKPKLDKMNEDIIQQQIAQQNQQKLRQQQEIEKYIQSAQEAIQKGTLGEVKLDRKTQASLYQGLTTPSFTTRRGVPTNELGHLLEKYQYTEPNFEKMYKVLWLLKDEKGFFEMFNNSAVNKEASNAARLLKTEQSKRQASNVQETQNNDTGKKKVTAIKRPINFTQGL